jgi:murein DD-endopeptidase MepM/ murein hydrolase activator NlpD
VNIDNIKKDSTISIENHFRPSAILQKDYSARFYLPMAYREEAKVYPLSVTINDVKYDYELDVKTFEFKQIHFTVSASVSSSTVGNNDAVIQYRETIYPLYETFETEEYWEGSFVLPVEGARVSSSFGEMRFVNNAKTPSRHSGIDYAVACGTDVVASNTGKVEYAGFLTMIGNTIVIDHGLGLKTFYEHMDDIVITQGDMVNKGDVIGHVGTTGYSTGCHLHFQGMVKNQSINPEFLYQLDN